MPMRVVRWTSRGLREHVLQVLIALIILNGILSGVLAYRSFTLANGLVANQQATCATGNEVRAHIRTVTLLLRNLIDVSLAIPNDRTLTPQEMAARAQAIETFANASKALTRRLPALASRHCSRDAVTSAPDVPAQ